MLSATQLVIERNVWKRSARRRGTPEMATTLTLTNQQRQNALACRAPLFFGG